MSRSPTNRIADDPHIALVRQALGEAAECVWIVGGTVRDALLGRFFDRGVADVDLAVDGDPQPLARLLARWMAGPVFALSETFGAWRVISNDRSWVCDLSRLQADTIEEDLKQRDFTVNAVAVPLGGERVIDPLGGIADCEARVLRVATDFAYAADALRPLRCVRLATELSLSVEASTRALTREAAPAVTGAAPERVFSELRRVVCCDRVIDGVRLADSLGLVESVLPEVGALHGLEQSAYHHLDVFEHTLEVLSQQLVLEQRLDEVFGSGDAAELGTILAQVLSQELTRGQSLRFAALLHDVGKPATRAVRDDGRVTFLGHDRVGAQMVDAIAQRLRMSERLRQYVRTLTRHHLVVGFMVHEPRPLSRRTIYRYLTTCQPVEVELLLLSCADRMATRGRKAEAAITNHLDLAAELMDYSLAWRKHGPPSALVRGDELAAELGIERGPKLGALLKQLAEATYAGEISTYDDAMTLARSLLERSR